LQPMELLTYFFCTDGFGCQPANHALCRFPANRN
jgi:hypothetical protein